MSRFDTVDLSAVPAPQVIEPLNYDNLSGDFMAVFTAAAARVGMAYDVGSLETDPIVISSEAFAYKRLLDRQRVNDAAVSVMLPFARGTDLDNLAALYKVSRMVITPADAETGTPAVMESDERLRTRVQLAPEAFATAGTRGGYIFHAMSVDANISDIGLIVPVPGQVDIIVQANANGEATNGQVSAVRDRLQSDAIRPLTVAITARAATIVPYNVAATLQILRGPDAGLVTANATAALRAYAAARFKVGKFVARSGLDAALQVPGVEKVIITTPPSGDVVPGLDGLARLGTITLTTQVIG